MMNYILMLTKVLFTSMGFFYGGIVLYKMDKGQAVKLSSVFLWIVGVVGFLACKGCI